MRERGAEEPLGGEQVNSEKERDWQAVCTSMVWQREIAETAGGVQVNGEAGEW